MLRSNTLNEWCQVLNVKHVDETKCWPDELCDLPPELHTLSKNFPYQQPSLWVAACFELFVWMSHYAKLYVSHQPLLFHQIWLYLMHEKYDVPSHLCRPFYELLADRNFRKSVGKRSFTRFTMSPPPEYDEGWEDVYASINPAIAAQVKSLLQ